MSDATDLRFAAMDEMWKKYTEMRAAEPGRSRYHYRVKSDGLAIEIGLDTHRELLLHLLAGESDERRIEELKAIWNATQPDRIESNLGKGDEILKAIKRFRSAEEIAADMAWQTSQADAPQTITAKEPA